MAGEGWLLTAEMAKLLRSGIDNIVCLQPFACLPNHVTGKGMIRKLMLEIAKEKLQQAEEKAINA